MPETLSFIDSPDDAMDVLAAVLDAAESKAATRLVLDHRPCTAMDLGASALVDVLVMAAEANWSAHGVRRAIAGFPPENERVAEMFRAAGLVKHLGVSGHTLPDVTDGHRYLPLQEGGRGRRRLRRSSEHEKAAQSVAAYFDECLGVLGFSLTWEGRRHVLKLVGEPLANAEDHSSTSRWHRIGYMHRRGDGAVCCSIAIFNFGQTIYQSLSAPTVSSDCRARLEATSRLHQGRHGIFGPTFTKEALWTLYSLQQGVSRFADQPGSEDRGNGLPDLVQFFQALAGLKQDDGPDSTSLCLLSGSARIVFDQKYRIQEPDSGGRRIIAFNENNCLTEPPDPECVSSIRGFFPGTLISARLVLRDEYLRRLTECAP